MRHHISLTENNKQFVSQQDVTDIVVKGHHSPHDFTEGDLLHRLEKFEKYVLEEIPISYLDLNEWYHDEELSDEYHQQILLGNDLPPIVFDADNNSIIDGTHRANAASKAGKETIMAFVGYTENIDPHWDDELYEGYLREKEESIENFSPAFRAWFGNSVIKHKNGVPRRMYHGSIHDFDRFYVMSHFGTNQAADDRLQMNPNWIGGKVYPVYLSVQKPLFVGKEFTEDGTDEGWLTGWDMIYQIAFVLEKKGKTVAADHLQSLLNIENDWEISNSDVTLDILKETADVIKSAGYDGIIYENVIEDRGSKSVIVLYPNQVKSVFNKGHWNKEDDKITEEKRIESHNFNDNFWKWFGNSQVVDMDGNPLIVYHGTATSFEKFDFSKNRSSLNKNYTGDGFFFSPNPSIASDYAGAARNQTIRQEDMFDAVKKVFPPIISQIFIDIVKHGYDRAWLMRNEEEIQEILKKGEELNVDLNDLFDLAQHVEGTNYYFRDDVQNMFNTMFGSYDHFPDWAYKTSQELGLDDVVPKQQVIPVYLRIENLLTTDDPDEVMSAKENGYDGVLYYGEGIVGNTPEFVVFEPNQIKSIFNNGNWSKSSEKISESVSKISESVSKNIPKKFNEKKLLEDLKKIKRKCILEGNKLSYKIVDLDVIYSCSGPDKERIIKELETIIKTNGFNI